MAYEPVKRSEGWGCARPQRLFQILSMLYDNKDEMTEVGRMTGMSANGWFTTGKIASTLGLTQSPHFRGLMDELLGGGHVMVIAVDWRPNMQAYAWKITDSARWSEDWKASFDAWLTPEEVLR